jgi:DNA polymerase III alpha subunit
MSVDNFGIKQYSSQELITHLYQGKSISNVILDPRDNGVQHYIENYVDLMLDQVSIYEPLDISIEEFDKILQNSWLMPEEYKKMDIEGFLVNECPKQNYQRLIDELREFRSRDMLDLLRWLKYFVDTCRKNQIVWGVGRGSSVSSYTLFLIGVHKIDSVKYNLDWQEFLR